MNRLADSEGSWRLSDDLLEVFAFRFTFLTVLLQTSESKTHRA
jgi:hypothetical protein